MMHNAITELRVDWYSRPICRPTKSGLSEVTTLICLANAHAYWLNMAMQLEQCTYTYTYTYTTTGYRRIYVTVVVLKPLVPLPLKSPEPASSPTSTWPDGAIHIRPMDWTELSVAKTITHCWVVGRMLAGINDVGPVSMWPLEVAAAVVSGSSSETDKPVRSYGITARRGDA